MGLKCPLCPLVSELQICSVLSTLPQVSLPGHGFLCQELCWTVGQSEPSAQKPAKENTGLEISPLLWAVTDWNMQLCLLNVFKPQSVRPACKVLWLGEQKVMMIIILNTD